jgi:hypothetical protein
MRGPRPLCTEEGKQTFTHANSSTGYDECMLKHDVDDGRGKKGRYLRGSWFVQTVAFSLPRQRKEEKPELRSVQSKRQVLSGR